MYWRVRTTLPDRPGALAELAAICGEESVNILGLQIFPGVEEVTDELVLSTPDSWGIPEIADVIERAGGRRVSAAPCSAEALADQPTRHVAAAREILEQPACFPEVLGRLLDAESDPLPGALAPVQDVLALSLGEVEMQLRRTAPFTATERARATALRDLVLDVMRQTARPSAPVLTGSSRRIGGSVDVEYVGSPDGVCALVDGVRVGSVLLGHAEDSASCPMVLEVDPGWRRRGIGTRLLTEVVRRAGEQWDELVLSTDADNRAVLPLVMGAGLRARIRMAEDRLHIRIPVREGVRRAAG